MDLNLKKLSDKEFTLSLKRASYTERKITHVVLLHILEAMDRKIYEVESHSLVRYLMKTCGYSEPCAYQRIHAANLLKAVPSLANQFASGALNLTQIAEVQKCLKLEQAKMTKESKTNINQTAENIQNREKSWEAENHQRTEEILKKIEHCNGFQTKQILAQEFDLPLQHYEKLLPQKDESVTTQMNFSKEDFEAIQQLKSLMSHLVPDGSLSKIFTILAKEKLQSKLGKSKAAKKLEVNNSNASLIPNPEHGQSEAGSVLENLTPCLTVTEENKISKTQTRRIYISVKIKRQLLEKAHHQCEYTNPNGCRCESTYQLQLDHHVPLALGGSNDIKNLRILCRTHNNFEARRRGLYQPLSF